MDTLTHSLLGALTVRSVFPAQRSQQPFSNRQRMLLGAVAAAFPDIDYLASWIDPMVYLTLWHRSVTHSFVMLPLWALLVGAVMASSFGQRSAWRYAGVLAGVAIVSHILSDLITVYGTQILSPLSGWRASIGTTFIIDPWFTAIVLAGCLAAWRSSGTRLPQVFFIMLVVYVGFQGVLKFRALAVANAHAAAQGMQADIVKAFPQPFSPFNWKLLIRTGDSYRVSYLNLNGGYQVDDCADGFFASVGRTYRGEDALMWERYSRFGEDPRAVGNIRRLWESPQLADFRRFAEFPVLYRIDNDGANSCVWFTDLRYVLPYMTPPFRYGLCREGGATAWTLERLRGTQ